MKSELESYEARLKRTEEEISTLEHKSSILSALRLCFFLLAFVAAILVFVLKQSIFYFVSLTFIICFFILCYRHIKVLKKIEFLSSLAIVNKQYISRINGDFNGLLELSVNKFTKQGEKILATERFCGNEFKVNDHDYANDLDCFGNRSLFSLLNVSETAFGRAEFANELLNAPLINRTIEDIKSIQDAVKDLAKRKEFLQVYQATARIGRLSKMPNALLDFSANGKKMNGISKVLYRVLPVLWVAPVVGLIFSVKIAKVALISVILLNFIVWVIGLFRNAEYFKAVDGISRQVSSIKSLFEKLENENFDSALIKSLLVVPGKDNIKPSEGLSKLEYALFFAKLRSQPIFAFLFNVIVPLDWFTVDLLGAWAEDYGNELKNDIVVLSKIETMMCLAQVSVITPDNCYPEFISADENNSAVITTNIVHPLINPDLVVANNVSLNSNIALITGSNMSGKTTMMRTVGVNLILAYMGAPVMATSFKCGRMRIMTSMRIVDSIEENMSTFKAELVRISKIISASEEKKPLLFLIDEIFRGTNSDDRTAGALTVLNNLSYPYICGMMTTHDYNLIDKTNGKLSSIVYYHFSEHYTDDSILFDYKLESGISRSSNAQYLMRLVGIN